MPYQKISIADAPAWTRKLQADLHKAAMRGLLSAGQRLVGVIQTEIIPREPRVPVDRGIYKAGWRARATPKGAVVSNATPAAAIIEHGARAKNIKIGRAMVDALTEWVLRKGLVAQGKGKIERAAARVQAQGLAWAIARDMQKRGIFDKGNGLGILAKAMKRAPQIIKEEVAREIAAAKR
jgi:hypothetical protein